MHCNPSVEQNFHNAPHEQTFQRRCHSRGLIHNLDVDYNDEPAKVKVSDWLHREGGAGSFSGVSWVFSRSSAGSAGASQCFVGFGDQRRLPR
jgi:hypothetical protein